MLCKCNCLSNDCGYMGYYHCPASCTRICWSTGIWEVMKVLPTRLTDPVSIANSIRIYCHKIIKHKIRFHIKIVRFSLFWNIYLVICLKRKESNVGEESGRWRKAVCFPPTLLKALEKSRKKKKRILCNIRLNFKHWNNNWRMMLFLITTFQTFTY